jgi:hypothetical protein
MSEPFYRKQWRAAGCGLKDSPLDDIGFMAKAKDTYRQSRQNQQ